MEINLIWCQSENNVIGQKINVDSHIQYIMPWQHNIEDMKHFKQQTICNGKNAVLMGYNTWLSIGEKILPNRENFVLTKSHYDELNTLFDFEGNPNLCHPVKTIDEAIRISEFLELEELWIIGGGSIYNEFLNNQKYKISKIYQTIIPTKYSINSNTIQIQNIPNNFSLQEIKELSTCRILKYINKNISKLKEF